MNIFVARLDYSIQDSDLKEIFEVYGEVSSVKIITDKFSGRSKGFGFVEMPVEEEGLSAIEGLNNTELKDRNIVVKKANPMESNNRSGGGRGFNRNRY
ncbi:MAG: RNA-binding protein [Chlorobi bacterium]|nr:RNA-binding protein [Chlorobiota bacterium]